MRRFTALLVASISLALLWGFALSSQASADKNDCPSGYICLWDGSTFGMTRAQFHDNGWQNLSDFGFNDQMSSIYNNTNRWGQISVDAGGGGNKLCMPPGTSLGPVAAQWNNNASAVQLIASGSC